MFWQLRPWVAPSAAGRGWAVLALWGRLDTADVDRLTAPIRRCQGVGVATVVCDVSGLSGPDVGTIDALARLGLLARRSGCSFVLRGACPQLRAAIVVTGLAEQLPVEGAPDA